MIEIKTDKSKNVFGGNVRYVYAIFFGTKWAIGFNKENVLKNCRKLGLKEYYRMPRKAYGGGGWDAPTFRAMAEKIVSP
jgi:hypothetical protein